MIKLQLPIELVKMARRKELDSFESKAIWKHTPIVEAWRISGRRAVIVRWADVTKGDDENPEIPSRLVAKQTRAANEDPMLLATPPFEVLRTVLNLATTDVEGAVPKCRDGESPERVHLASVR